MPTVGIGVILRDCSKAGAEPKIIDVWSVQITLIINRAIHGCIGDVQQRNRVIAVRSAIALQLRCDAPRAMHHRKFPTPLDQKQTQQYRKQCTENAD